jgi:hypothetical protein
VHFLPLIGTFDALKVIEAFPDEARLSRVPSVRQEDSEARFESSVKTVTTDFPLPAMFRPRQETSSEGGEFIYCALSTHRRR